jgi:RHS repeat-associated protein
MDPANSAAIVPTQFLSKIYYAYDALGNRIGLTAYDINGDKVEDRSFVFENGRVLLEYDKRDRLERERFYAMGSGELLAINDLDYEGTSQTVSNSERIWTLLDYQGSVANLYASSSRFLATSYDPFGRLTRSTDVGNDVSLRDAVPTGYLGMDFDPETLLYIEGGRPYDPAAGRYLTAGSMAAGTYNIYAFANNTPVDRSVRDVRGAGMQGIVGGSPIGAGTGAFFGSIGGSLSCIGNGVVQPFLNYYDFGRTLIDAGAELVGYHWNHESVSDMGQAAESGTTMLQLEMALLKGLGTNVADTVTIGGYATYQYRNGDINDSEYGDRILGVGLNFAGGAGLLKAAGLGKVTVAQASIGGVRAISTSVGRVVDVARKIEFNPQAITQVYSGIPVNMLRWKKVAEGFGMAAESIAPSKLATLNEAGTGIARMDMLAVKSQQYARFKNALEARGVQVIEDAAQVSGGAMAQSAKTSKGVVQLFVDPSKTRYIDVLHEWRHIRQFEQASTTLQAVPGQYAKYLERGLEAGALRYEYRLAEILSRRQGSSLSRVYEFNTIDRAMYLQKSYEGKLRSPTFQNHDSMFPFK